MSRLDFLIPNVSSPLSGTVFQGESPDEHAARIQVSAGERRDAVYRRQPPSRRTLAQERPVLFTVQGDESFLMESVLSIHLLSLVIIGDSRRRQSISINGELLDRDGVVRSARAALEAYYNRNEFNICDAAKHGKVYVLKKKRNNNQPTW